MTRWARLPIRYRLSIMFGASTALVVAGLSIFVYSQTKSGLLATVDANLNSRAALLVSSVKDDGPSQVNVRPEPIENIEVFAQIDDASGQVLRSTPLIARSRLLSSAQARSLRRATLYDKTIPGIANVTRILVVPVAARRGRLIVAVGTSLRPVERMRRQAAAISASDPGRRLSLAAGKDEIALLGATLNQMLDRIEESVDNERRLVDRASHELRTPLAIQRIDLDVALSGPQTAEELRNALASVSVENTHLTRLTQDLLVLSRARGGVLPVQLADVPLPQLLDDARRRHGLLNGRGVQVSFEAPDCVVRVDPVWFRQAVDNLVDNALRHTPPGGQVEVRASLEGDTLSVVVEDTGPGFGEAFLDQAFEPFTRSVRDPEDRRGSAGLGLAVVSTIARAHGGKAWAQNRPEGGAQVTMMMNSGLTYGQPGDSH